MFSCFFQFHYPWFPTHIGNWPNDFSCQWWTCRMCGRSMTEKSQRHRCQVKASPAQTGSNNNTFFSRGISKHGLCCPMQGLLERGPWKVPHPWYGKETSFIFDFELYPFQVWNVRSVAATTPQGWRVLCWEEAEAEVPSSHPTWSSTPLTRTRLTCPLPGLAFATVTLVSDPTGKDVDATGFPHTFAEVLL